MPHSSLKKSACTCSDAVDHSSVVWTNHLGTLHLQGGHSQGAIDLGHKNGNLISGLT